MGKRLFTKTPRVNESGELLVNFSAIRIDGLQVGEIFGSSPLTGCVPFIANGSPLTDRKHLVMTVPVDRVFFGPPGTSSSTGFKVRGAGRGANQIKAPQIILYSNRKQFLRSQYMNLPLLSNVEFCVAFTPSAEIVNSLDIS